MTYFIEALRFLTLIPIPRIFPYRESAVPHSTVFFPVVGFLIGIAAYGLLRGIDAWFGMVHPLIPAFFVLVWITAVTRGLHLDGLADAADGLIGGKDPEARLRIMKDSSIGSFGAIAINLVLLGKYAALVLLCWLPNSSVVLIPFTLSRWTMVLLMFVSPYVRREGGLGSVYSKGMILTDPVAATAITLLILSPLKSGDFFQLILLSLGVTAAVTLYSRKKIGGITGDVIGAVNELVELACLFYIGIAETVYSL